MQRVVVTDREDRSGNPFAPHVGKTAERWDNEERVYLMSQAVLILMDDDTCTYYAKVFALLLTSTVQDRIWGRDAIAEARMEALRMKFQ